MIDNYDLSFTINTSPSVPDTLNKGIGLDYVAEVLKDYAVCALSREISLIGRREVLSGKGKFGIFGDGKEVPQMAMARVFKKGDWRAGYYRDQTLMFALGVSSPEDFFAQLYADCDNDPFSGGRQMNAHFATPNVDKKTGEWTNHLDTYNMSSDISATAGQVARAVGFALASKKYREIEALRTSNQFSQAGNEVCFCTIGDASTSEGPFFEAVNAAAVMQIPLAIFVWDDGYGISVPTELQTAKGSISEALRGFENKGESNGIDIYTCKAWDYPSLCATFEKGIDKVRQSHTPAIFHVQDCTQPQGHSTSGSHERYKSEERLQFERDFDCNIVMRHWILESGLATDAELKNIEVEARARARDAKNKMWAASIAPLRTIKAGFEELFTAVITEHPDKREQLSPLFEAVKGMRDVFVSEIVKIARRATFILRGSQKPSSGVLTAWILAQKNVATEHYSTQLYSETANSALQIPVVAPLYSDKSPVKSGYEIINAYFDKTFEKRNDVFAFGEDVGNIGDVNQGFMGLQAKYGKERIFDAGIREWTIMGQAIGMAMRGLRPIAEIQYLDYIYYALAPLADDLTTLRYRTNGLQQAPAIIRTRGHRLEGIWHSGSPMGMILGSLRGMYVCVPRNFVQAAGMYETLLSSNDPALVIEPLNAYRLKEKLPDNIGNFTVPLGVPERITEGSDVTLVTYGSCVRIAEEAAKILSTMGVSVELMDVQTLIPFDLEYAILDSLKKTNRIIFLDEDVPNGGTAYMLTEVLEKQGGYKYLDAPPTTITSKEHRPPYGSDGDYFSKPNIEDVVEAVLKLMTH
ncbi:MAG: thiamine pyrophosphate-dependent enzyme [Saprospiraceae bacterium]|nr:thiamine pyrophosphate-dependent enzyme [Saprospiraceae bacterium]